MTTTKWQPIETAPRDGRLFLCWVSAVRYGETDEGQLSQESKTPRTDAEDAKYASISKVWYVPADFARQLERELAAVTEDRDAFMASSRITKANEATANARIAFMSDAEAKVAQYPPGWRCEWVCDWGDQRSTACYPEALEAIDAAMKECSELRAAREIEPKGSDQ